MDTELVYCETNEIGNEAFQRTQRLSLIHRNILYYDF
jgi:hypothetical protein